jgi:hypothetical protein
MRMRDGDLQRNLDPHHRGSKVRIPPDNSTLGWLGAINTCALRATPAV